MGLTTSHSIMPSLKNSRVQMGVFTLGVVIRREHVERYEYLFQGKGQIRLPRGA